MPWARKATISRKISADEQRRHAERRLVEHQNLRLRHQAARDGQHLLLPAGEIAGDIVHALAQHGKQRSHRLHAAPRVSFAGDGIGAEREIFRNRHAGENLAPLGHLRDAAAQRARPAAAPRSRPPRAEWSPLEGRSSPEIGFRQRRFAGAVGAQQRDDLAALQRESMSSQHAVVAVSDRDAI